MPEEFVFNGLYKVNSLYEVLLYCGNANVWTCSVKLLLYKRIHWRIYAVYMEKIVVLLSLI